MSPPRPIPPRSVVKLSRPWPEARQQGHETGEIWRIGYYSPQDGLDCIWLVDRSGHYFMTADHDFLEEHFDIVSISNEEDFFGTDRPLLTALTELDTPEGDSIR